MKPSLVSLGSGDDICDARIGPAIAEAISFAIPDAIGDAVGDSIGYEVSTW